MRRDMRFELLDESLTEKPPEEIHLLFDEDVEESLPER